MTPLQVKFWGVRGSIPAPITSDDVRRKVWKAVAEYELHRGEGNPEAIERAVDQAGHDSGQGPVQTFGGNTSCVEVVYGDGETRIVLDMGTGLRPLGNKLFGEMLKKKGLKITFLLSHVHWDHIQGLPFFGELYWNSENGSIENVWSFYGGTDWQRTAEECLKGQMDPPVFPVSWREIERITHEIQLHSVSDMMSFMVGELSIQARKLDHPQETYGYRITTPDGRVVVYSTDNEPRDPNVPAPPLLKLAEGADLWITDCQYTCDVYNGKTGVPHHGWGHSYPEAVAKTAIEAGVKTVVLFHHDPGSSDEAIADIRRHTQDLVGSDIKVIAAWEGLELTI